MNDYLKSIALIVAAALSISACSTEKGGDGMNADKTFATPEEAVAKAKSDLIEVLQTGRDINLGIDLARLREAQQGRLIRYVEVDFARILTSDSVASLGDIVAGDKSTIAPFVLNNDVVGIVEVTRVADGWKVAGLAHRAITDDLNQSGSTRRADAAVTVYEVPNLQVLIYGVRAHEGERYHLSFDRFNLKEPVPISAFYPLLRERALQFNARFGEEVKKGKLVK